MFIRGDNEYFVLLSSVPQLIAVRAVPFSHVTEIFTALVLKVVGISTVKESAPAT